MEDARPCGWCDAPLPLPKTGGRKGANGWDGKRQRKWCSNRCSLAASRDRRGAEWQAYSDAWVDKNREKLRLANIAWREAHPGCIQRWQEEARQRRQADPAAYAERQKRYGRVMRQRHREEIRAKNHKREMLKLGRPADKVSVLTLLKEQGGKCALCGRKINPRLKRRHPMMASTDHVLPISKGGNGLRSNLRAVHLKCNREKRDKVWGDGEQLGLC